MLDTKGAGCSGGGPQKRRAVRRPDCSTRQAIGRSPLLLRAVARRVARGALRSGAGEPCGDNGAPCCSGSGKERSY